MAGLRHGLPQGEQCLGAVRRGAMQGGTVEDSVFVTMGLYTAGLPDKDEALTRLASQKPSVQICILEQEIIESCLRLTETSAISDGMEPPKSRAPNPTLMQMKYSRVIWLLSKAVQISIPDALDVFLPLGDLHEPL